MSIRRLFVEKKENYRSHAEKLKNDIQNVLSYKVESIRYILRYDIEGLDDKFYKKAKLGVFSEPPVDYVYEKNLPANSDEFVFAVELLPGQYDQRADSAAQCVQLLTRGERPSIRCAVVYAVKADLTSAQKERLKSFFINPVESREANLEIPKTLKEEHAAPESVELIHGFIDLSYEELSEFYSKHEFAMSVADLMFVQSHFKAEFRNPTATELKVIDTYWSDHCRHTTFLTALKKVTFKTEIPNIQDTYAAYLRLFNSHYNGRADKYPCLMDIATMGARELKKQGMLDNLDESDEINACSIKVTAIVDGHEEDWLVMFKNETHNHPTEIEPYGGAATCLGGAIRDPLSGRVYVYQAMRITGAADITQPTSSTLKGKLPQRVISRTAADGFSSYGNQIGLATGIVNEIYHSGYVAKRLETGFVVGAARAENVVRSHPKSGDKILLIGGETGRDGCGGATGSSKAHTVSSIEKCGAEVQKGNPLTERKIQRLFRNGECTKLIKKCNDFGAGGVCVAIGELADGLDIHLDNVPKKYQGLSATEIAISESQERMAVVVEECNVKKLIELCAEENLDATVVASVTDNNRMRMYFNGGMIVDLSRKFLNSNGARQEAEAVIKDAVPKYLSESFLTDGKFAEGLKAALSHFNVASQKGLVEIFDSTVGAGTVLMPFGGKYQLTPSHSMAAKLPVLKGETDTATVAAWGYNPDLMSQSPFVGAIYSVLLSVIKVVITGAPLSSIRLTFQEFFKRLKGDPERWGEPVSALLGALYAQLHLGLAAIGGKDSMSGSFEKLDVPPTLISFALGIAKAGEVITNVLTEGNQRVYRYSLKRDTNGIPDFEELTMFLNLLSGEIKRGRVKFAAIVETGGAAAAVAKSCFGNGLGFSFENPDKKLFQNLLGDILIVPHDADDFIGYNLESLGVTVEPQKGESAFTFKADNAGANISSTNKQLPLKDALNAFNRVFENVYPTTSSKESQPATQSYAEKQIIFCKNKVTKPKVFIPVFPGTNCEYDMAKSFEKAGAEADIFVFKNRTQADINSSVKEMAKRIDNSQIIAFPGGFSGGDEPDGSGKFIATTFQNKRLSESVMSLLNTRDGLAIGICNGFQALVKLGLLPYGKICGQDENAPTLTFNDISRHVSTIGTIRVASTKSPWLKNVQVGEEFIVAISHGEGKFVAQDKDIQALVKNGQIATQYVDFNSNASGISPFNPNGSYMAIEGITSVDGRVFGKMGHSERMGHNLIKNVAGKSDMKIFEAGVEYFI